MFGVPFVKKNIKFDKNKLVNSIREHAPTLKVPNPWAKQSDVITSIAAGSDDAWQDVDLFTAVQPVIKEYLEENNFIITTAKDSNDARKKLEIIKFDIIILDIMMPGESGLELTKRIKN